MRSRWSMPILATGESWRWRIRYTKFRGRGPNAFEKESGADGIFQIEVAHGPELQYKGLLFQAKKAGSLNGELRAQVQLMETLVPGGSAVFEYGPNLYRAAAADAYLAARQGSLETVMRPLATLLAVDFLSCGIGQRGLYFEAVRGLLRRPNGAALRASLAHRIEIDVETIERS